MKAKTGIVLSALAALCLCSLTCGKASITDAPEVIGSVDLSLVKDGTWDGEQDNVGVAVTVLNHRITSIDYTKTGWSSVGRKAQYIRNSIIQKQSLDVDVISGATISSKDILKAVEIALQKGIE